MPWPSSPLLSIGHALGINGGVTGFRDTTGVKFLAIAVGYITSSPVVFGDSYGNSYLEMTVRTTSITAIKWYVCWNPIVGTAHSWSVSAGSSYSSLAGVGFGEGGFLEPNGVETGGGIASDVTFTAGPITPAGNGSLVLTASALQTTDNLNVSAPFSLWQTVSGPGVAIRVSLAWLIQSTVAPISAQWNNEGAATTIVGTIASFLPGEGGSSAHPQRVQMLRY